MRNFRSRILLLLLALVVVTQVAAVIALVMRADSQAQDRLRKELHAGGRVLDALLRSRASQLNDAVRVLAADYGFKEAATSGDTATTLSALENASARIDAELAAIIGLDGSVVASTVPRLDVTTSTAFEALRGVQDSREPVTQYQTIGGQPYVLVLAPIRAPTTVGLLMMGFAVDRALSSTLSDLLGMNVSFYDSAADAQHAVVSTFDADGRETLHHAVAAHGKAPVAPFVLDVGGTAYLTWVQPVAGASDSLMAVLQQPMQDALSWYRQLRSTILVVATLAILLAIPVGRFLAREASRPLEQLVVAAQRIEAGDYSAAVTLDGPREFSRVAATLNSMQSHIAEREGRIRHQATHDALSGLPNRLLAQDWLAATIDQARARGGRFALLLLQIRDFDRINASLGQSMSDDVLREVARRLASRAGPSDLVARVGVAEFLLCIPHLACEIAATFGQQLIELLQSGLIVDNVPIGVDARVGICLYPDHGDQAEQLLRRVDTALYDAREHDTAILTFESGRDERHRRELAILGDLRRALGSDELTLHFQPKVDMNTYKVRSLEALVRWTHPTHGVISPDEFIPLAERTGTINLLTDWVVRQVLRQMRDWRAQGFDPDVAINLSAADLLDPQLPRRIMDQLRRCEVPPSKIVLEITEGAVMRKTEHAVRVIEQLRHYGVRFSIDDFGTGYSSLAQLKRLPVDEIKIDKSFVLELKPESEDAVIVRSTIDLGHNLGVKVVAEGVETAEAWRLLVQLGCDYAQGYLVSKPLPAAHIVARVAQLNARLESADSETQQIRALRDTSSVTGAA